MAVTLLSMSAFYVLLSAAIAIYVTIELLRKRDSRPLPPGPKGLPVFGNINDMPKSGEAEWLHWLKHKDEYGPISSVTVLGQTIIIINDLKVAYELLRDRSVIYSGRPSQVFSGDIVGIKYLAGAAGYNDLLKAHRKNIAKISGSATSLSMFDRVQETESAHFLLNLLAAPEDLFEHIRREARTVILKVTYGYTTKARGEDPLVDLGGKLMHIFDVATTPGKWLVDILPFMNYLPELLPGTGFKAQGRQMAQVFTQASHQPYNFVKQQMREKRHKTSFLSQAIEDAGTDSEAEFINKWSALSLFTAGADTTVAALMTFFLAIAVFPEVQQKAQEELDRVIGNGRLPVSADRDNLPYIMAVVKETHRWEPIAPLCLPHSNTSEDIYNGYRIPKSSIILPNLWWFTHNPDVYADPMTFNPSRFISTPTKDAEPDPRNVIFGFGRRVCPGRYVADNALFITIAQTLAVFDIEKLVENGKVVEPEVKFTPGLVSQPLPYRVDIRPRSAVHKKLIVNAAKEWPWEESDAKELIGVKW